MAHTIQDDAQRMRKVIPELQSEIDHLKAVRETLIGDFEDRTRQVQRLESEVEKNQMQPKDSVPARLYQALRDEMASRLRGLAEERNLQIMEIQRLQQEALSREKEISDLQWDVQVSAKAVRDKARP